MIRLGLVVFAWALAIPGISWAGNGVLNGGPVFAYPKGAARYDRAEVVDYHFGQEDWGLPPDLGDFQAPHMAKVEFVLNRLKRLSPDRARKYLEWAKDFDQNSVLKENVTLTRIPDDNLKYTPASADAVQIVIQSEPQFPEDRRYMVSKDLWQLLNEESRAGLILHEVIYREAIQSGQTNSYLTQYFNAYISSGKIDELDQSQFNELLRRVGFKTVEIAGLEYQVQSLEFYPGGQVKKGDLTHSQIWSHMGLPLQVRREVEFYSNGRIKSAFSGGRSLVQILGKTVAITGESFEFLEDGSLKRGVLEKPETWAYQGLQIVIENRRDVEFYSGVLLKRAYLGCSSQVWIQEKPIRICGLVHFHEDGSLKRGALENDELTLNYGTDRYLIDAKKTATEISFRKDGVLERIWGFSIRVEGHIWVKDRMVEVVCWDGGSNLRLQEGTGRYLTGCDTIRDSKILVQGTEVLVGPSSVFFSIFPNGNIAITFFPSPMQSLKTALGERAPLVGVVNFHEDETPKTGELYENASFSLGSGQKVGLQGNSKVEFFPSGAVSRGYVRASTKFSLPGGTVQLKQASSFDPNGIPLSSYLDQVTSFQVQGKDLKLGYLYVEKKGLKTKKTLYSNIEFHPNGKVKCTHLGSSAQLLDQNGDLMNLPEGALILLDEEERVKRMEDGVRYSCILFH